MQPFIHGDASAGVWLMMWNVSQSVGKGGVNKNAADIAYAQFYYALASTFPLTDADRRLIYSRVKLTGTCTGRDDDPLVRAIVAHQRCLEHPTIDGRISVAQPSGKIGEKAYFVLRLGARFATMYPEAWPRLDKIIGCPQPLAAAIRATIPAVPTTPP